MQQSELSQTLSLEEAFAHELAKDVKLKGGGTAIDPDTGQPLKPAKAIAMSIMQQALKGDIAAVSFIRNFMRQTDPQEVEQRKREAADKLAATTQTLRAELERDNLWTGQVVELEQLAQDHCIIDRLNQLMQADDYQDILTDEEHMRLAVAATLGGCATTAAAIILAIVFCLIFCSCTTTRYVPVTETRTEHHWHTDSVHQTDTIIDRETTVIRELDSAAMARYGIQIGAMQTAWLVQSDRLQRETARLEALSQQRDTVRDTIPKPYPVEVVKEVPRDLTLWQQIRQGVGGFALFLLLVVIFCKIFERLLPKWQK